MEVEIKACLGNIDSKLGIAGFKMYLFSESHGNNISTLLKRISLVL